MKKMKKLNKLYLIATMGLLFSNTSFSQKLIDDQSTINNRIVQKLNTPTKMWVNGHWETTNTGTRMWKKGHWSFEEKSFQQKSEIFRKKMMKRQKA
mgnify:CR=1 FL=1|tara:strand:+ start:656 stop:943 length:288 start_codon:yes stop_codon:yes gene_type:complete